MDSEERAVALVIATVVIGFFYGFMLACLLPPYDYLCNKEIEGKDYCFHSSDGDYVVYYTKNIGIHTRQGSFYNTDDTLEDDYKVIGADIRRLENLKCDE